MDQLGCAVRRDARVQDLSDTAFRLLVEAWFWCVEQDTGGFVPHKVWRRMALPWVRGEVVSAGLARRRADGVQLSLNDSGERLGDASEGVVSPSGPADTDISAMGPEKGILRDHLGQVGYPNGMNGMNGISHLSPPRNWRVSDMESSRIGTDSDASPGNHIRWHVTRNQPNPACDFCRETGIFPSEMETITARSSRTMVQLSNRRSAEPVALARLLKLQSIQIVPTLENVTRARARAGGVSPLEPPGGRAWSRGPVERLLGAYRRWAGLVPPRVLGALASQIAELIYGVGYTESEVSAGLVLWRERSVSVTQLGMWVDYVRRGVVTGAATPTGHRGFPAMANPDPYSEDVWGSGNALSFVVGQQQPQERACGVSGGER